MSSDYPPSKLSRERKTKQSIVAKHASAMASFCVALFTAQKQTNKLSHSLKNAGRLHVNSMIVWFVLLGPTGPPWKRFFFNHCSRTADDVFQPIHSQDENRTEKSIRKEKKPSPPNSSPEKLLRGWKDFFRGPALRIKVAQKPCAGEACS